jgi:hypothetical protein
MKNNLDDSPRRLRKAHLAGILLALLAFSLLIGVTGGAMGLGSMYPAINLIASPIACPGRHLAYSQQTTRVGSATYYTAEWFCTDDASAERSRAEPYRVYMSAGLVFGVVIFAGFFVILVLYWNSAIGPAKNRGPRLW